MDLVRAASRMTRNNPRLAAFSSVTCSNSGLKMLQTIVSGLGFSTDGYDLRNINAISSDGKTIVGGTSTPSGIDRTYVVRLP